jgi:hypothetical protein
VLLAQCNFLHTREAYFLLIALPHIELTAGCLCVSQVNELLGGEDSFWAGLGTAFKEQLPKVLSSAVSLEYVGQAFALLGWAVDTCIVFNAIPSHCLDVLRDSVLLLRFLVDMLEKLIADNAVRQRPQEVEVLCREQIQEAIEQLLSSCIMCAQIFSKKRNLKR